MTAVRAQSACDTRLSAIRQPEYTLKTANSTAGSGIFLRISAHVPNPVKYLDPDGRNVIFEQDSTATDADMRAALDFAYEIEKSQTDAGEMYRALKASDKLITIKVKASGKSAAYPGNDNDPSLSEMLKSAFIGGDALISFNPNGSNAESTLAHEIGHAYAMVKGFNQWTRRRRETYAMAVENQYRVLQPNPLPPINTYIGETFGRRPKPLEYKNMPHYDTQTGQYYRQSFFGNRPYTVRK
jgi:hypothetical protein